ncbi:hypothetical protein EVAR_46418_1 [Eumeta japonica]|uniref:Uncharacterized protein n=1 Tax=Eumeta variegata TaxID=151549 RepID=A0A4C1XH78_EUMVA|nr:hypothetical protein EVAR_46418_1 [Eumeta japonica]
MFSLPEHFSTPTCFPMPRCPPLGIRRTITCRWHPMPISRDRRSPQISNLLGLRTTAKKYVASGVFSSVKVGNTPRSRVRGSSLSSLSPSPRNDKTKKKYKKKDHRDTLEFDVIAPLTPTHFSDKVRDRPDILDIALMRNVNHKLGCIEPLQRLSSGHRPVLMRLGPISDNCLKDKKITTNWKKVSIALKEINIPSLNKIPNDIESTNDIDNAISTLTSHITKVVKNCSRKVPVNSYHRKLPTSVHKLMRAKNAALRRAIGFPTPANRS